MATAYDDALTRSNPSSWLNPNHQPQGTDPMSGVEAPGFAGRATTSPTPPPASSPQTSAPAPKNAAAAPGMPQPSGYLQDLPPMATAWGDAPTGPTLAQQPGGSPGAGTSYTPILQRLSSASDPQQQAMLRDQLARSLQSSLEGDGHKVSWAADGSMTVDGRAYELGDGAAAPAAGTPASSHSSTPGFDESWLPPGREPGGIAGPPAQPAGTSTTTNSNGFDVQQFLRDWQSSGGRTNEDWVNFFRSHPEAAAAGYRVQDGPKSGELIGPNGEGWDTVYASGEGGKGAQAIPFGQGGAGAMQSAAFDPSVLNKYDNLFDWLDPNAVNEIPGFEDLFNKINGADPNEDNTSSLIRNILEHPESLDDKTVEMLKSKNAEELGAASQMQDEELQHFGAQGGISDSPWLASERASNAWDRRSKTVAGNRDVDMKAAETRMADKRAAAQLGQSYGEYRTNKTNMAISTAVNSTLQKLGAQASRVGINNSFKQAAKQLGLSEAQVRLGYIQANNNFNIDMRRLSMMDSQFQQELAEKIAEFSSTYSLQAQEFQHRKDQDYWQRARDTYSSGR